MSCHRTPKSHSTRTTGPTDVITYRHNGQMVYVAVASNYAQALSHAREAFPQLKDLRDASLSLSFPASGSGEQFIGISAQAWPKLITHMTRYQVIEVFVTPSRDRTGPIPDITITYADTEDATAKDPVPPYSGRDVVDNEKASKYHNSPTPPTSTLHSKRSWLFQMLHQL